MVERIARTRDGTSATPATGGVRGGIHSGAEARARAMQETEASKQNREAIAEGKNFTYYTQRRFKLDDPTKPKANGELPSTAADIIILDRNWDEIVFVYQHTLEVDDGRFATELCVHETSICPLCAKQFKGAQNKHGGYTMHATCLDLRGVTSTTRGYIPHIKRPLILAQQLHNEYLTLFEAAMKEYGTIRGMQILVERDASFNSATGRPKMRPDGAMYVMLSEEEIRNEFDNEEFKDDEGVIRKPAHFDIEPYPYLQILPDPKSPAYLDYLRQTYGYGGNAPPGSREETNQAWGRDRSAPQRTRSRINYAAVGPQEAPDDEVHGSAQATARVRTRAAPTAQPAVVERVRTRATPAADTAPAGRVRTRQTPAAAAQAATQAPASRRRLAAGPPTQMGVDIDDDIPF